MGRRFMKLLWFLGGDEKNVLLAREWVAIALAPAFILIVIFDVFIL